MIAIPHEKWDERPLAVCVLREGQSGDGGRAARVPRAELRQVLAAGRVRVRRRDPEDGGRQVPQDGAAGAVRASIGPAPSEDRGQDVHRHGRPLRPRRGHRGDARARGRHGRDRRPARDGRHRRGGRARARSSRCDELHGAVNCAGIGGGARVIGFPLDRFRKVIEVNLIGTFNVLRRRGEDGRGRAGRGGNARRDRQHGLERRLRRPDRPGRLLGLEGRRRRDDAADRARPRLEGNPRRHDRARPLGHADARRRCATTSARA